MVALAKSQKLLASKAIFVTLINAVNKKGQDIYFYVAVAGDKILELQKAMRNGSFDVSKFGDIIASGLGDPTKEVMETIETKFGCKHDNAPEIRITEGV